MLHILGFNTSPSNRLSEWLKCLKFGKRKNVSRKTVFRIWTFQTIQRKKSTKTTETCGFQNLWQLTNNIINGSSIRQLGGWNELVPRWLVGWLLVWYFWSRFTVMDLIWINERHATVKVPALPSVISSVSLTCSSSHDQPTNQPPCQTHFHFHFQPLPFRFH